MQQISQNELDERIAILKRFRFLLEQQRAKFQEYLEVLEMQETDIDEQKADAIIAHTELENQIVSNISSLQKIIVPMQNLYEKSGVAVYNPQDSIPVTKLQDDLSKLRNQVLAQNEKNRGLIKNYMQSLRVEMNGFKNPYRSKKSVYAGQEDSGQLVQIEI